LTHFSRFSYRVRKLPVRIVRLGSGRELRLICKSRASLNSQASGQTRVTRVALGTLPSAVIRPLRAAQQLPDTAKLHDAVAPVVRVTIVTINEHCPHPDGFTA